MLEMDVFVILYLDTVDISNHSNTCIYNFTKIMGCHFNYSAPVTTHQFLQSNYTWYQDSLSTPTGLNLTLVRKLPQHDDLNQLLKQSWIREQRTPIIIHHDTEKIHHVLERMKKDGKHGRATR